MSALVCWLYGYALVCWEISVLGSTKQNATSRSLYLASWPQIWGYEMDPPDTRGRWSGFQVEGCGIQMVIYIGFSPSMASWFVSIWDTYRYCIYIYIHNISRWWFQTFFMFYRYLWKWSNLMGGEQPPTRWKRRYSDTLWKMILVWWIQIEFSSWVVDSWNHPTTPNPKKLPVIWRD